ncbi:MAG: undecaprenyl diphosphate synthase family protein [Kofleriaceae bacterium]|nr:MAG: undecaprenyl diphosphate synthase family protein [Kofleriaceae bacterium]
MAAPSDFLAALAEALGADRVQAGELPLDGIDVDTLGGALPTGILPSLDLLIRTSGEQRVSNFLLWESAYAKLMFVDVMWPDFRRTDLFKCLEQYAARERRFGLTSAQLADPESDVEPTAG